MPGSVVSDLERIMCKFLWEGHSGSKLSHLVKWETVLKALQHGGLGIGNLTNRNAALLFKWNRRFLKEQVSLWCKVIKSIHGIDPHLWHTSGKFGLSLRSPWISISKTWSNFGSLTNFKLGNGRNIFFWLDAWCSEVSLQLRFARLHQIASLPNGSVNDHWDSDIGSWNFSF